MRIQIITVFLLLSCNPKAQDTVQNDQLKVEFSLPKKLKEVSGITLSNDQKIIWAIEDQGNKNSVFALDRKGNLLSEIVVENAENTDWEDITKDKEGNLYIGDFGNNENDRKNLSIIKLDVKSESQAVAKAIQSTTFRYEGQTEFPPSKSNLLYDCEAFVEKDGMFYLFTKNRSKAFDGTFLIFQIPNKEGDFEAKLVGKLKLEGNYDDAAITAASINSKNEIVLLTHSNIHLLTDFSPNDFNKAKIKTISLDDNSQKEAIVFVDDTTLLIADEKDKKTGGNVYQFKIN